MDIYGYPTKGGGRGVTGCRQGKGLAFGIEIGAAVPRGGRTKGPLHVPSLTGVIEEVVALFANRAGREELAGEPCARLGARPPV